MSVSDGAKAESLRVCEVDEGELITRIFPLLSKSPLATVTIGDDCSVYQTSGQVVASTDMLVENRHFKTDWSNGFEIGKRAAGQNLADAAAMGAKPFSLLVSLGLPFDTPVSWVEDFARGLSEMCAPLAVGIDGGDLSSSEEIVIAVTVLGDMQGRDPVLRCGAKVGDVVAVAGSLGCSRMGYELLEKYSLEQLTSLLADPSSYDKKKSILASKKCVDIFRSPNPAVAAGILAANNGAHAMMDISDGLLIDARRMAKASGVTIDIFEPIAGIERKISALAEIETQIANIDNAFSNDLLYIWQAGQVLLPTIYNPSQLLDFVRKCLLTGGEDHSMLACFASADIVPAGFRVIGTVQEKNSQHMVTVGEMPCDLATWDHFKR